MGTTEIIKKYIEASYSPIRAMIGVPEILEIRHKLEEIDCGKCIVDLEGGMD